MSAVVKLAEFDRTQPVKVGDPMSSEEGGKLLLHKGKNDHCDNHDHQHHHVQESPIGTREGVRQAWRMLA